MKKIVAIFCFFAIFSPLTYGKMERLANPQNIKAASGANQVLFSEEQYNTIVSDLHKKGLTIHSTWAAFKPDRAIRRDESAKMLTRSLIYLPQPVGFTNATGCVFTDLDKARSDLRPFILQSCTNGLFRGNRGVFNPDKTITNGQLLTVVGRMLFGQQDESNGHYASEYVNLLEKGNYLSGLELGDPDTWKQPSKRGDVALILHKILIQKENPGE